MVKLNMQKIAVIGDGITGKLASVAFSELGYLVDLIALNQKKKRDESIASLSISNDSFKFLQKLKIKNLNKICNPVFSIKLYENTFDSQNPDSFFYNKKDDDPLSYIVLKKDISASLDEKVKEFKIKKILKSNKDYALTINTVKINKKENQISWDYDEEAYTFIIQHQKLINNSARQFFLKSGPLAFLPLSPTTTSIVWSLDKRSEFKKIVKSKEQLVKFLNKNFTFLKSIKIKSKIESFPLSFNFLKKSIEPRQVTIGDVSHRIHPLAGQGWNMSVRDIKQIYEIYFSKKKYGYDLGDYSLLEDFERKTKVNNLIFSSSIDIIRRVFKIKNDKISKSRKTVFRELEKFPEIKKEIIKFADKGLSF